MFAPIGSSLPNVEASRKLAAVHTHGVEYDRSSDGSGSLTVQNDDPESGTPSSDSYIATVSSGGRTAEMYTTATGNEVNIQGVSGGFDPDRLHIQAAGQGDTFDVQGPRMAVNFLISLNGTYPPRS